MNETMTSRERLMAAIRGEETDRISWSPFLAYWWESQPREVQARGQLAFFKELGADGLLRGFSEAFRVEYGDSIQIHRVERGMEILEEITTPVGVLRTVSRYSTQGNTYFVVDHPVKTRADYETLMYLAEKMIIVPAPETISASLREVGDDGLLVPQVSVWGKTAFQALLEHYVGTEQLVYDLADQPEVVEACLGVMNARAEEGVRAALETDAEVFLSWEDTSTTNVSPRMFRTYIYPEIRRWNEQIHAVEKYYIHHACGTLRALLPVMAEEGADMIESVSPPPTGDVEIWEAQEMLKVSGTGIVGGIEPTQLLYLEMDALKDYVGHLLDSVDHRHYILANSDSCPPGVSLEKFQMITGMVRSWKAG
ncbi:MAG: hypothetical protein JW750_05430 [Anaerolineaceae bacterium]|nr:hypothetical protein [Anaerolineaceae bacterium]